TRATEWRKMVAHGAGRGSSVLTRISPGGATQNCPALTPDCLPPLAGLFAGYPLYPRFASWAIVWRRSTACSHGQMALGASRNHHQKPAETERGCARSTSRSGTARPRVLGPFGDFGHPHLLRLVLRTQPRSGGGSKMRPMALVPFG